MGATLLYSATALSRANQLVQVSATLRISRTVYIYIEEQRNSMHKDYTKYYPQVLIAFTAMTSICVGLLSAIVKFQLYSNTNNMKEF